MHVTQNTQLTPIKQKHLTAVFPDWVILTTNYYGKDCGCRITGKLYIFHGHDYNAMLLSRESTEKFNLFLQVEHMAGLEQLAKEKPNDNWDFEIGALNTMESTRAMDFHCVLLRRAGYLISVYHAHEF